MAGEASEGEGHCVRWLFVEEARGEGDRSWRRWGVKGMVRRMGEGMMHSTLGLAARLPIGALNFFGSSLQQQNVKFLIFKYHGSRGCVARGSSAEEGL